MLEDLPNYGKEPEIYTKSLSGNQTPESLGMGMKNPEIRKNSEN